MSAFQREALVCFLFLFIVSLCITYVQPFVVDGKTEDVNKTSDLFETIKTDIDNVLTRNGLNLNELQEADGRQIGGGGGHHGGGFGGGKKKNKHMAFRRILYPVLMGLFIAKIIIFPLLLKALTIMSSASFVLSKMSLLSTIMLGFKWFLTQHATQPQQESKVEVVHVPLRKYQNQHTEWDRETDKYSIPMMNESNDNYYNDLKPTTYVK
ncbi:uncharacterized protein LOC119068815 [Bradysia coprophila]|uniref:uncharacterized protein LOC119068815 n=1 Tax=Bradysia coprophila TaxID=38358 RepID=UPI00187D7862|nr:uncharacterized protein LOC119068815 [Bradysia coprophila]